MSYVHSYQHRLIFQTRILGTWNNGSQMEGLTPFHRRRHRISTRRKDAGDLLNFTLFMIFMFLWTAWIASLVDTPPDQLFLMGQ